MIRESNSAKIIKVISGGQTGADQGGLAAAKSLGIETGGWAPKGWLTEDGPNPKLLKSYGLKESHGPYPVRTVQNIKESSFTIIIADKLDRGSLLTANQCLKNNKLFFHYHLGVSFIPSKYIKKELGNPSNSLFPVRLILNVAGNRESRSPGIYEKTKQLITKFLEDFNQ